MRIFDGSATYQNLMYKNKYRKQRHLYYYPVKKFNRWWEDEEGNPKPVKQIRDNGKNSNESRYTSN